MKNIISLGCSLIILLSIACGGGEKHNFTGKLETKVKNASDY